MIDLKLDTLNKKPKVYNIAVLTAAVALIWALMLVLGGLRMLAPGCLLLCGYALAVSVLLIRAFFLQMRYNLYSYNTIIYFGFSVFMLFVALSFAQSFFVLRHQPEAAVLSTLTGRMLVTAKTYILFSSPFLLVFSIALVVSNVSLIRHEGFRFVNILGILLSVCMVGGELFLFFSDMYTSGSVYQIIAHDLLTNTFAALYLYVECMLIGTIIANLLVVSYEPEKDKDYIIVLGCGIRDDGTPMPLLAGRVDRALEFYHQQIKETGKAPIFVPSGGQGPDEVISESQSMKNYLVERGVPEEHVLLEDRSTSTYENMLFSKELIESTGRPGKVVYSTTNYHVFRAGLMARRVKMRAQGMGAKTKWYFWPNANVREFVGILAEHRLKQAIIICSMVAIYAALTLTYYLAM